METQDKTIDLHLKHILNLILKMKYKAWHVDRVCKNIYY